MSRPAFTLIEVILYVTITAIVIVSSTRVMLSLIDARERVAQASVVQQDLRFAMSRMVSALLDAGEINTGSSTFGDDAGVLSLNMSGSYGSPLIFYLSDNRIHMQEGGLTDVPLTSSGIIVDQLHFINLSGSGTNGTIKVIMHAKNGSGTATHDLSLETSVTLRH